MARKRFAVGPGGIALWLMLAAVAPAAAHEPPATHGCSAPSRPADDQNELLWQDFLAAVDAFRGCISDYAQSHHRASDRHREAANAATVDWNRFVRAELNVPEDYPWPPREDGAAGVAGG